MSDSSDDLFFATAAELGALLRRRTISSLEPANSEAKSFLAHDYSLDRGFASVIKPRDSTAPGASGGAIVELADDAFAREGHLRRYSLLRKFSFEARES